jgi:hypothetical protein
MLVKPVYVFPPTVTVLRPKVVYWVTVEAAAPAEAGLAPAPNEVQVGVPDAAVYVMSVFRHEMFWTNIVG